MQLRARAWPEPGARAREEEKARELASEPTGPPAGNLISGGGARAQAGQWRPLANKWPARAAKVVPARQRVRAGRKICG